MLLLKILINLLNQIAFRKIKILIVILIFTPNFAHSFKSDADYALLIEYDTDQVLYEKNSREILDKTLEEDLLLDEFSIDRDKSKDDIIG